MKKLFQILAVAIILATVSFATKAQSVTPAYKAAVSELMELTKVREVTEQTLTQTYDNMGLKFTIPTAQVVSKMFDSVWDNWVADYAVIYSKYFSLEELQQLCAFYDTPLGKKLTKCTPEINRDAIPMMQKYQPEFTSIISRYIKQ